MPLSEPTENKEGAARAFKDIAELLRTKYFIDVEKEEDFGICKDDVNNSNKQLRKIIDEIFKYDSWNSF